MNPITTQVAISICKDADDAIQHGFNYREPEYKGLELKQLVVVRDGTEKHNSTVDFVVEDESGQRYVFMITGNLLKSIPA